MTIVTLVSWGDVRELVIRPRQARVSGRLHTEFDVDAAAVNGAFWSTGRASTGELKRR
jgi:hypothetical protein